MPKHLLPIFSPDGSTGGGYQLTPEQLAGLSLSDENPGDPTDGSDEAIAPIDSVVDTPEGGGEQPPSVIDIPGIGEVSIDDINAWKNGHMMQSDYTKKTQELAEQRRQFEEKFAPYQKLDEMFAQNPQLEQQFVQLLQQNVGGPQTLPGTPQMSPPDISQHPMFQQMQQQQQEMQAFMKQQQEQALQEQVKAEWNGLFEKFPDAKGKEQELASFADQNGLNLEQAYMILNFNNLKQQTQAEMVKNNMKKKPANTVKPNNNAHQSDATGVPDGDYNSLVNYLMKKDINL